MTRALSIPRFIKSPRLRAGAKAGARHRAGFSLTELLMVVVIMTIVTGAAFTLFQIGARHEARQQDTLSQTMNLRGALHTMARDVRMAGNGLVVTGVDRFDIFVHQDFADPHAHHNSHGWFRHRGADKHGVRAIFGIAGVNPNNPSATLEPNQPGFPDALTIFRAAHENPLPIGKLLYSFTPGTGASFILQDNVTEGEEIADGDMVALVNDSSRAVILQASLATGAATSTITVGDRFKPDAPLPGLNFPAGSRVFNLRDVSFVTYYIERGADFNRLMANHHYDIHPDAADRGLSVVAGHIDNMKVAYRLMNPDESAGPTLPSGVGASPIDPIEGLTRTINEGVLDDDESTVCMASLSLLSRSSRPSHMGGTGEDFCWPGGGGGTTGCYTPPNDGHTRRMMIENINLRNNGRGLCTAF